MALGDLRAKNPGAVGKLALAHPAKQVQALRHAPVAKRAVAPRALEAPAAFADLFNALVIDVCLSFADQPLGARVHLLEAVGSGVEIGAPVVTQPAQVLLNRLDLFRFFGRWIGVVKAQVRPAAILSGEAEVENDRFGMANVQKAIRLGREPGDHLTVVSSRSEIGFDDLSQEIGVARRRAHGWRGGAYLIGPNGRMSVHRPRLLTASAAVIRSDS